MELGNIVEQRITEAIAAGELQPPLEGTGRPLNLDAYFAVHEDDRMAYGMLKSSGFTPPEVDWLREMGTLREQLQLDPSDRIKRDRLAELETAWNLRIERARRR